MTARIAAVSAGGHNNVPVSDDILSSLASSVPPSLEDDHLQRASHLPWGILTHGDADCITSQGMHFALHSSSHPPSTTNTHRRRLFTSSSSGGPASAPLSMALTDKKTPATKHSAPVPELPPISLSLPRISIESLYRHGRHVLRREGGKSNADLTSLFVPDRSLSRRPRTSISSDLAHYPTLTKMPQRRERRRTRDKDLRDTEMHWTQQPEHQQPEPPKETSSPSDSTEDFAACLSPAEFDQILAALKASTNPLLGLESSSVRATRLRAAATGSMISESTTAAHTLVQSSVDDAQEEAITTNKSEIEDQLPYEVETETPSTLPASPFSQATNDAVVDTDTSEQRLSSTIPSRRHCSRAPSPSALSSTFSPALPHLVQHILHEFLTTERTYVQELSSLFALYIRPFIHEAREWSRLEKIALEGDDYRTADEGLDGVNDASSWRPELETLRSVNELPPPFRRVLLAVFGNVAEVLLLHASVILPALKNSLRSLFSENRRMDKASRREDLENVEIGVDGLAEDGKDKEVSEGMSCLYCSVNEDHSDTMDECCRNIALEFRWMGRPTLCEAFSDKDEVEDGSADSASAFPAETLFANMLSGLCEAEDTIGLHCYRDFLTGLDRSLQLVVEIEALAQLRSTAAAAASTGIATLPRRPFLPNQTSPPHSVIPSCTINGCTVCSYGKEAEGVARERIQAVRLSERYFSEDDDSTPGESVSKHLEPVSPVSPGPASAPHGSRARFRRRGSFPKGLSGVTSPLRGDGEASTRRDGKPRLEPLQTCLIKEEARSCIDSPGNVRTPGSLFSIGGSRIRTSGKRHSFDPIVLFGRGAPSPRPAEFREVRDGERLSILPEAETGWGKVKKRLQRPMGLRLAPVGGYRAGASSRTPKGSMKDEGRGTGVADEATTELKPRNTGLPTDSIALAELARIIGIVAEDPRRKQIGLGAYLVLPLQRLTRYGILMDRLAMALPEDHSSRLSVVKASEGVRTVIEICNSSRGPAGTFSARFHCAHQKTTPPGRSSPIPAEERQEDPQNGPSNEGLASSRDPFLGEEVVGSAVFVREHATLEYIRPTPLVEDAPNGKSMEVPAAAIVPELSPIADVHLKDSRDQGEKKSISERVSLFFKRVAAMWKRKW